jgi:hypothetical protein
MHEIGTDRDCCEKRLQIEILQGVKETEFVFLNHSSKLKKKHLLVNKKV